MFFDLLQVIFPISEENLPVEVVVFSCFFKINIQELSTSNKLLYLVEELLLT